MAAEYFLKIDGIPGESVKKNHVGEIELLTWSWGETQSGGAVAGAGGASAGKANVEELRFSSLLDKSGPKLMIACASGTQLKAAGLSGNSGSAQFEFLQIKLTDVIIASYEIGAVSATDARPTQQASLRFGKIGIEYRQQKPDGAGADTTKSGWDVKTNKTIP
jgi:type VI secretion system secreted protein Hcp